MRVNKSVGLGSFAQTAGDLGMPKIRQGYVPPERDPSLTSAPANSIWERPSYATERAQPMRPGANDHLKYKSKGF